MSGRRCELYECRERLNFMQIWILKAGKRRKRAEREENHGGETFYCRNRCIDGLLYMPAIWKPRPFGRFGFFGRFGSRGGGLWAPWATMAAQDAFGVSTQLIFSICLSLHIIMIIYLRFFLLNYSPSPWQKYDVTQKCTILPTVQEWSYFHVSTDLCSHFHQMAVRMNQSLHPSRCHTQRSKAPKSWCHCCHGPWSCHWPKCRLGARAFIVACRFNSSYSVPKLVAFWGPWTCSKIYKILHTAQGNA